MNIRILTPRISVVLLPALLLSACAHGTVPALDITGSANSCNKAVKDGYPWRGDVGPDPLCLGRMSYSFPKKPAPANPPDPNGPHEDSSSTKMLAVLYNRSLSYCLYYKNQNNRVGTLLTNGSNFGDAAVALAAPIAAFAAGANASITGLVGGVAGVFGTQLKTALNGAMPDSSTDYGQTMGAMKQLYDIYKADPRLDDDAAKAGSAAATDEALAEFRIAMTQICFSSLSFSGGGGGDHAGGSDQQKPGGSDQSGDSHDQGGGHHH